MPDADKRKFIEVMLNQSLIARMATADLNGQPHVVPVWYGWDGESIWISSFSNTRKISDIEKNPKISICVDIAEENGNNKAVVFEGTAVLVREPHEFLRRQSTWIYTRYLGEEGVKQSDPQSWIEDPLNLLIKLTPEKTFTWDY